jgi:HSP20 family molecular chaperone IbpA
LRIERSADQGNYYLTIKVEGVKPEEVTVAIEGGRWLAIGTGGATDSTYENVAEDRSAYYRSFSYRTSSRSRRISLPRDADAAAMKRENGEGEVRVTIPRLPVPRGR